MKKSLTFGLTTLFLTGCVGGFGGPTGGKAEPTSLDAKPVAESALTRETFVDLSAEILCLRVKFPETAGSELRSQAESVIDKYGFTEKAFDTYRVNLAADAKQREEVGYAIIARVNELCPSGGEASAVVPESTEAGKDSSSGGSAISESEAGSLTKESPKEVAVPANSPIVK